MTFAKTFKRPRCGIPITADFTPCSTDLSIKAFIPGMRDSQPSKPNLFSFGNFVATNLSNESDQTNLSRIIFFSSKEKFQGCGVSILSLIQSH